MLPCVSDTMYLASKARAESTLAYEIERQVSKTSKQTGTLQNLTVWVVKPHHKGEEAG